MEYYSIVKKNEILPSATSWMDLAGIIPGEIRWTEIGKYCRLQSTGSQRVGHDWVTKHSTGKCWMSSPICGIQDKETKKQEMNLENRFVVTRGGDGRGRNGWRQSQKAQTSSDKTVSPGDVMYSMVTTFNNTELYIWKLLRESIFKVLITRKKFYNCSDGCYQHLLW